MADMEVYASIVQSVCAYFTEERRQLLGSWEAADVQCMDPQTAVLLVAQLSSVIQWEQGIRGLVLF